MDQIYDLKINLMHFLLHAGVFSVTKSRSIFQSQSHFVLPLIHLICLLFCVQSKTDEVLKSIDNAMEFIHMAATSKGGVYTKEQRDTLQ